MSFGAAKRLALKKPGSDPFEGQKLRDCLDMPGCVHRVRFMKFLIGAKLSRSFQSFFVSTSGQEVNLFWRIDSCLYYISFPHIPTISHFVLGSDCLSLCRSSPLRAGRWHWFSWRGWLSMHINQGTQHQWWALPHPDRGHHNFGFCEIKVLCRFQCPLLCGPLRISVTKCSRGSNLITFV